MIGRSGRFELLLWSLLPAIISLILAFIYLTVNHASGLSQFMPPLPLIPIFYWGLQHAREMPYWFVALLGLFMDAVMGLPLGISSLLNILFLALLHAQRKYVQKEGFIIQWVYFAVLLAGIDAIGWVLLSLYYTTSLGLEAVGIQWILTICIYPAAHKLFQLLQDYIQTRRWQITHGR